MGISAALGSALVVPLAQSFGWGWEFAAGSLLLLPLGRGGVVAATGCAQQQHG